jgi:hypothetical protein
VSPGRQREPYWCATSERAKQPRSSTERRRSGGALAATHKCYRVPLRVKISLRADDLVTEGLPPKAHVQIIRLARGVCAGSFRLSQSPVAADRVMNAKNSRTGSPGHATRLADTALQLIEEARLDIPTGHGCSIGEAQSLQSRTQVRCRNIADTCVMSRDPMCHRQISERQLPAAET